MRGVGQDGNERFDIPYITRAYRIQLTLEAEQLALFIHLLTLVVQPIMQPLNLSVSTLKSAVLARLSPWIQEDENKEELRRLKKMFEIAHGEEQYMYGGMGKPKSLTVISCSIC